MDKLPLHRRELLKGLGAIAATSLTGGCTPKTPSVPGAIKHRILVTMENRSFNHYFTALNWDEGRDVLVAPRDWTNRWPGGEPVAGFHSTTHCVEQDPPHGWNSSRVQFDGGTCEGFIEAMITKHGSSGYDPALVMGHHNRGQLPVSYAMADQYVLCQRWFSSLMTGTWPNRLYAHAGQNLAVHTNKFPPGAVLYDMPTLWQQLDEAGIDWAYYYSDLPFVALLSGIDHTRVRRIEEFYWDCENNTLPAVCMVEPAFGFNDDHPPHPPILGQIFLASIHNALARSKAWNSCQLAITYDEHGGFADSVPPPLMPDLYADRGYNQTGFRVPSLLCGPWVKPGYLDDTERDHTSPLADIQAHYGLDPLTPRDEHAVGFANCLDQEAMANGTPLEAAELPILSLTEEELDQICDEDNRRGASQTGQPELEAFLNDIEHPLWMSRKRQFPALNRLFLEQAVKTGALVIR